MHTVVVPTTGQNAFFRLVERTPLFGRILYIDGNPPNDSVVSNVITVRSEALSWIESNIQLILIEDVFGNETNVLGVVAGFRNPENRMINVDTRHLSNGDHRFQLFMVDDRGNPDTAEDVSIVRSEQVSVKVQNPIWINEYERDQEWRFRMSFGTMYTSGTWSVTVNTNSDVPWMIRDGRLDSSGNPIVIKDTDHPLEAVYVTPSFEATITVTPAGGQPIIHREVWPCAARPSRIEVAVIEHVLPQISLNASERFPLDWMLSSVATHLGEIGDPYYLPGSESAWNQLRVSSDWAVATEYLRGRLGHSPTHLYVWGGGGPGWFGVRTNPSERVSIAEIAGIMLSNRPHFVFFDGFNVPIELAKVLGDHRERSFEELYERGRYPRVAFGWQGKNFSELIGNGEIDEDHTSFIDFFFELAAERDPTFGWFRNTWDMAYQRARFKRAGQSVPNPAARGLWRLGCPHVYPDELYISP